MLLGGLALYTLAGVLGALAASIDALIGWRALQGFAMAAAVTGGRSIIRDLYPPLDGARVMSRAMSGLGVIAFASPLLGGLIATHLDWHAALLVPALFGVATLALIGLRFEESVPALNPNATRWRPLARNTLAIARHPTFQAFTLLASASFGGLFVMLASSSFVFIDVLGASRTEYGAWMGSVSLAYIAGTLACRRLLARHGLRTHGGDRRQLLARGRPGDGRAVGGRRVLAVGHRRAAVDLRHRPRHPSAVRAGRRDRVPSPRRPARPRRCRAS